MLTALENFAPDHAKITQRALDVTIPGNDSEQSWKLIMALEDLEDVQPLMRKSKSLPSATAPGVALPSASMQSSPRPSPAGAGEGESVR